MLSIDSLFCLVLGVVVTLVGIALFVRRGFTQISVTAAYREVSKQLGLQVDTRGTSLQGHLGDRRLWIGQVLEGHGRDRRLVYWGVLDLERPLGIGLTIRRRGMSDRLFRRSRSRAILLGDAYLDRSIEVQAHQTERVEALFTGPVRDALAVLHRQFPDVVVTDNTVRVHLKRPLANPRTLMRLVTALNTVATSLDEARERLPPPDALGEIADIWEALAQEQNLEFLPYLPAVVGTQDGRRIQVVPVLNDTVYEAQVTVWFRPHRAIGIRVYPQVAPDGYSSVGQDIQVGEATFDETFVIKGYDRQLIIQRLTPTVRAALLAIHERGAIEIDDRCLTARRLDLAPTNIAAVLQAASTISAELDW